MKTAARPRALAPVALAAALLTAFLVLFAPLSASAHDALVGSSPAAGSTVEVLPSELTLTFSEELITGDGATEVLVTDAAGTTVSAGAATVNGATVTQPLVSEAVAGGYHVIWKIVSSDGHPTSGEFDFTVTSDTTAPVPTPEATPTTETVVPTETAAPSPVATASAPPSAAPDDTSSAGTWIWILVITGVLVLAAGAVVAVVLKRRGSPASTGTDDVASGDDSDAPAER